MECNDQRRMHYGAQQLLDGPTDLYYYKVVRRAYCQYVIDSFDTPLFCLTTYALIARTEAAMEIYH